LASRTAARIPSKRRSTEFASAAVRELEFRETVAHMGKVLQGENVIETREVLREFVGDRSLAARLIIARFERSVIPLPGTLEQQASRLVGSGGPISLPSTFVRLSLAA
jgi:hypothetical protein